METNHFSVANLFKGGEVNSIGFGFTGKNSLKSSFQLVLKG